MVSDVNWENLRLEDLASPTKNAIVGGPFGSDLIATDYTRTGVPVIRGENLSHGRWVSGDFVHVSHEKAIKLSANTAGPTDVIFTQRGANHYRQVAIVPPNFQGRFVISQSQMKITVDERKVSYLFLYYLFKSPEQRNYLMQNAIQTGVPHTNLSILRKVPLIIPPISVQLGIAQILGALDDKIELNRRMNETLGAMARAIFKDWITREDPSPTRKRISDFVNEGVLTIGDGYRAKNSELGGPGIPFIRAGNLNDAIDTQGADTLNEKSAALIRDKISQIGDVAFTSKGTIGRIARVGKFTDKFVYSPQICYWRTIDTETMRPEILYQWMISEDFLSQLHARSGQTDMAPYVSLRDQYAMTIPDFGKNQHTVADTIGPLLDRQDLNNLESRTLAATRDLLLPKLMSGEIRVKDAEEIASEVL